MSILSKPPQKHVMVDLETLGKKAGCVIASIGAVRFDPRAGVQSSEELLKDSFKRIISIPDSISQEFKVDGSTIEWWMNQSKEAQESTFGENLPKYLSSEAIGDLQNWFNKNDFIWGNGANFDIPILEAYFDAFFANYPWKYAKVRCFRTAKAMLPFAGASVPNNPIKHDCLTDAVYQAQVLQAIYAANPNIKED